MLCCTLCVCICQLYCFCVLQYGRTAVPNTGGKVNNQSINLSITKPVWESADSTNYAVKLTLYSINFMILFIVCIPYMGLC